MKIIFCVIFTLFLFLLIPKTANAQVSCLTTEYCCEAIIDALGSGQIKPNLNNCGWALLNVLDKSTTPPTQKGYLCANEIPDLCRSVSCDPTKPYNIATNPIPSAVASTCKEISGGAIRAPAPTSKLPPGVPTNAVPQLKTNSLPFCDSPGSNPDGCRYWAGKGLIDRILQNLWWELGILAIISWAVPRLWGKKG